MNSFSIRILILMGLVSLTQHVVAAGEPQVRFLEPSAGSNGSDLGVVVDASDADGRVREVNLYINNKLVRRERAAPYEWGTANKNSDDALLLDLAPGSYQLRAIAKDNQNKTASATRTVTVGGNTSSSQFVANGQSTLNAGDELASNSYLASQNGQYRVYLQGDGNLVLRNQSTGEALWSSGTHGQDVAKLAMQGDGNLVLYSSTNSAVWATDTNGQGGTQVTIQNDGNFVIYTASGSAVWDTQTAQGGDSGNDSGGDDNGSGGDDSGDNGAGGDNDAGGSGDNTAESTGEFSTPSAALYSLNSNKRLGFPKHIDTGFGGNGHSETWDGRIFVRTRTDGWFASAFRPERIVRNNDGSVAFNQGAFGNSIALELRSEASDMQHNWIAIVPDPSVSGENPYPSNSAGNYQLNGSHSTYKAVVYHTSKRNGDNDQMGLRQATFIISNANTRDAQLIKADFTSSFSKLRLQNGSDFRCIEPSVTIDGRLVVCQGHPDNNGRIDNLVYSWNPTPAATSNWRTPKSLSNMYYDDRNANVDGVRFSVRFPIAEKPITDATGNDYNRGELIKGAYPWISRDGSELFYQASNQGVSARRTGTSVVGRWTGWTIRHIDGPINRDRHRTSKLFLSSPGAFTTMWTPYKDIGNLAIPYSLHGPVYPIFGSNTSDYSEVGFDDYLDGNYVMYLGMNEQLNRAGNYQVTRTNDTSGNFNNASLVGAQFPIEFNGQDQLVGRYGQAIHFRSNNYLNVTKNKGWNTLADGVSIDMWVRKSSGSGRVRLFNMQNGVELNLINGSTLSASIHDTNSNLVQINGSAIGNNTWAHVAFTYHPASKKMALYVNGQQVATQTANNFGTLRTSGAVRVGPDGSNAQLILDEVKVSNVARRAYEIAHNANVRINKAPSNALANQVPEHFRSLLDNATGVDRFSLEAANLGEDLFSDTILSKQRTTSCATCHDAGSAFTDGLDIARGNEPTDAGTRNTPMLQNRLFSSLQGWSGIDASLDTQALTPVAAAHEMNLPITEAVQRLRANSTYSNRFQQVFGEAPNAENFPIALASFEALQFSPKNRVDEFKEGNKSVLSAAERRGLDLFEGKARCSGCHAGANFTDESFRHNGLAMNDDIGRADVTGRDRDHKLFKVPSLRELGLTGPYMHDGSIANLRAVVEAYNAGAVTAPTRDTDMRPLELSNQEINDVVAFLGALSENGASGGNTGGSTNVSEVSRVNGKLVGGAGSAKPGFTLYVFDNDIGSSSSNCVGGCVNAWPPVLVEDSGASGVSGLSTITRGDGTKQAAYNGRPLYFFASDASSSDTKGDGVNGVWWIADDANSDDGDNGNNNGDDGNTGGGDSGGGDSGGSEVGGEGWTQCASENGVCNFSGTRIVAYGANGTFTQKTFTNSVNCNNGTFGDPTPGVAKQCWYKNDNSDNGDDNGDGSGDNNGGDNTGGNSGTGAITVQVWENISGTNLSALTGLATYPDNPTSSKEITSFEAQSNWADNYGTRIVGYLHAPVTGTYTFWIATDDNGELWLSTNDSASNKRKIASITSWAGVRQWTKFPSQKSASITLQAGQRYFIEALQKEGGGGDNIAVAWQRPGGSLEVIPGQYLSPITSNAGEESNVALGKPTSQSSTAAGGLSSRAVDGNTSGVWGNRSVTHTAGESKAWWKVDLEAAHQISKVTLWNRTDCCSSRLANFHVDALDANGNVLATKTITGAASAQTDIALSASGVYSVRVQLNGSNYLSLAEVQVFGSIGQGNGDGSGDDNGGGDTGNTNQSPSVSFIQPSGSTVSSNLGVVVAASDSDGSISQVELFINNNLVRVEGGAPYEWGTANANSADNALLNLAPGSYELRAVATDNDGASKTATRVVTVQSNPDDGDNGNPDGGDNGNPDDGDNGNPDGGDNGNPGDGTTTESATFEKRISSSSDDAEEQSNGSVNITSSDLELTFDNSNQTVGMRFTNVTIPQGATITDAYIQFTTDETNSGSTSLRVFAHDTDDAPAFSTSSNNISDRSKTNASSAWSPAAWNSVGAAGNDQRTNELKFVVQEVINRNGWQSGNDMAFIVTGSGERTAESYDGSNSKAPLLHIEYTYETSGGGDNGGGDNGGGDNDGGGDTGGSAELSHVGSSSDYSGSGDVRLNVPAGTREGDLLMAFVSRTDDLLPIKWNGWTAGASCYKTDNGQRDCHEIRHCSRPDGDYCLEFNGGNGRDLATVVFYKTATANEPSSHRFNLRNNHAGWGILTTLRGADNNNPIRNVATESNDNNPDSLFPSVNGNAGDLLMTSMAFDDTASRNDFGAPPGMELFSWINGEDEAGYVYGEILTRNGQTGTRKTSGPGGPNAKDALIALTVRPGTSNNGGGGSDNDDGSDNGGNNTGDSVGGDAQSSNNWLSINGELRANQYIVSENGLYRLYLQGDGNIVLRDQQTGASLWSSGTHGKGGTRLVMQTDGNFVLYTSSGAAVWASGTNRTGASRVVINNDGSLAIYSGDNPVWAQNGSGNTGSGDNGGNTGGGSGGSADGVKIAFIGDTGAGGNFQNVLNLIKSEGAELTVVAGDTSYSSSRDDDWDRMVRDTLGNSDPALVVAGNHDYGDSNFGDVRSYGQSRLNRQSGVQCSGAYAEQMTCNYKGIYFVMSAIGASGSRSNHESFITNSLNNAPDGAWRVCAWHKNQREMQVGGKTDETGWTAYETCRQKGAIISTGHEHSYSRTHLLSDMSEQSVSSTSSTFTVSEGRTFAFVSGLGGIGIRDQERGGDHWAKIYTSSQGARYGAMFGTFYEDRAEFYFKNINGQIIDQFTVMKGY